MLNDINNALQSLTEEIGKQNSPISTRELYEYISQSAYDSGVSGITLTLLKGLLAEAEHRNMIDFVIPDMWKSRC